MTPREKAEELVGKFYFLVQTKEEQKQCSLIAVDEIMEFMKMDDEYTETLSNANSKWVNYWIEVKNEIEKL